MNHFTTGSFWEHFGRLPEPVQAHARRAFAQLQQNPRHPSLCFKKVGAYWSARVGRHYRAMAIRHDDDVTWFWIGHHAEYDDKV